VLVRPKTLAAPVRHCKSGDITPRSLTQAQEQATLRLDHNLQLEDKDRTVLLELQWSIAPLP
jgi:hypothetical protein